MKKRALDIKGFGPVTVRALSSNQYWSIAGETADDYAMGVALLRQRGVMEPEFKELERLEGDDDASNDIANAILELTKPNLLADDRDNDVKASIRARYGDD